MTTGTTTQAKEIRKRVEEIEPTMRNFKVTSFTTTYDEKTKILEVAFRKNGNLISIQELLAQDVAEVKLLEKRLSDVLVTMPII